MSTTPIPYADDVEGAEPDEAERDRSTSCPTDLRPATVPDVIEEMISGAVSSEELTRAALARAHAAQGRFNAFVDIDDEAALTAARDADRRRRAGDDSPLLGLPIAVKDDVAAAGRVTGFGSAAFTTPAGTVAIGRTTLPRAVQLVGAHDHDARLMSLAGTLQRSGGPFA